MSWLFDKPIYIVVIGAVLAVLVGAAWSASGRKELLYALAAIAGLVIVGLIVERAVVTDSEAIRATLMEIARDVQSNNVQRVTSHIAASEGQLVQKAQSEMPNYRFTECRLTKIHKIDIHEAGESRTAIVEFNIVATGTFRQGSIEVSDTRVPRWIRLDMVREADGAWRVRDYHHEAPQQMMFEKPLSGGNGG